MEILINQILTHKEAAALPSSPRYTGPISPQP